MDRSSILNHLKSEFGIKDKHILIINALETLPLTAEQISKRAEIPLGRIYEYLNQLIGLKLIEKTTKKPYYYEIKDFNKNVMHFLKHKTDKVITAKAQVLELMKDKGSGIIEVIDSKEAYSHHHLHIISEGKHIKIITHDKSFPLALYPRKWDDFIALRNMVKQTRSTFAFSDYNSAYLTFKTYKDAYDKNKLFSVITQKSTWENTLEHMREHFGALYVQHYLKNLEKRIKNKEIVIHLTNEYLPMELDLNQFRVGVALRYEHITTGIVLQSADAVNVYHKLFEQIQSRSEPLMHEIERLRNTKLTQMNLGLKK